MVTAARTYRIYGTSKPEQQEWMASIKTTKTEFFKRRQDNIKHAEVRERRGASGGRAAHAWPRPPTRTTVGYRAQYRQQESIPEDMRLPQDEVEAYIIDWALQALKDSYVGRPA